MRELIYGTYDQAGLDREYDNRNKVAGALGFMKAFSDDSAELRQQLAGQLNVQFGPGVDETLDVFPAADGSVGSVPIQVFIHGGYWKMLTKDEFSYVARAFSPKGAATVVVNYGLIPNIDMDELVRQCRAALAWTYRNADSFGGDPDRIFISGHSAGGHLVAMMMATDWPAFATGSSDLPADLPADLIKGGCGISGLYDLEPIRLCFLNDDLKLGVGEAERNSPLNLAPATQRPLLLVVGGDEGPEYLCQSEGHAAAWRARGVDVEVVVLPDQNHFSIVDQLNDPTADLSQLILRQMGL